MPRKQNGVGAFVLQCRKLDFHYCDWAGSSKGMKYETRSSPYPYYHLRLGPTPRLTEANQLLHPETPAQVRCRTPRDRDHRIAPAVKTPHRQRTLRQWEPTDSVREEPARQPGTGQGRAAAGFHRREEQED